VRSALSLGRLLEENLAATRRHGTDGLRPASYSRGDRAALGGRLALRARRALMHDMDVTASRDGGSCHRVRGFSRRVSRNTAGALAVLVALGGLAVAASASPSWSFVSSPNPAGSQESSLNGVVCLATNDCMAVGESLSGVNSKTGRSQTLIEHWDGRRWSILRSRSPGIDSLLSAVSCTAARFCVAVGSRQDSQVPGRALVEQWNGTKWSMVPSGINVPFTAVLRGVSCRTSTDCIAVGYFYEFEGGPHTLVDHWDGRHWSMVPSPTPRPNHGSALLGVSCTTATACVAVGYTNAVPLVEQWNGRAWLVVPSVHPPRHQAGSVLASVKCTSNTSCVAVGHNGGLIFPQVNPPGDGKLRKCAIADPNCIVADSLIERWNGTVWSIVASPNLTGYESGLFAVKCVTTTDCVAVGGPSFDAPYSAAGRGLIEQWNGTAWSIVASAGPTATTISYLAGVSCPTATNCVAVGAFLAPPYHDKTFAEHHSQ
jgi:hypothetical protein